MKLRIKGNSLRLRLTKSDVENLCSASYLEDSTSFGANTFKYILQSKAASDFSAEFNNGIITIYMPSSFINGWNKNDVVGFNSAPTNEDTPYILVEKDFKCLDETTEDQSDNFENPHTTCQE